MTLRHLLVHVDSSDHCAERGSNRLTVMGANGQYAVPVLHRGGSTRRILAHMTMPVLMSH